MRDLILILGVAGVFVFGYFIMKKLDVFMGENAKPCVSDDSRQELRIGFSDPALVSDMIDIMDPFSRSHPSVGFCFYYGRSAKLRDRLLHDKLDIVLLPVSEGSPWEDCNVTTLRLLPAKLTSSCGDVALEPVAHAAISQNLVWKKNGGNALVTKFAQDCKKNCSAL